jgi:hypothetical protein
MHGKDFSCDVTTGITCNFQNLIFKYLENGLSDNSDLNGNEQNVLEF